MGLFSTPKKQKIGLCLGGGGARGFAHMGALKAFSEEGLHFDMVAGTSVGSLIAGLFAAGMSPDEMIAAGDKISLKDVHSGFTPNDPLKIGAIVRSNLGDVRIEDLPMPLYIVAVDLVEARQVIIDRGFLYEAVSASCAVPIFFKPFLKGRMHLVDGGLLNNIPADVLRMMGADHVVTVDINSKRGAGSEGTGLLDVAKTTLSIVTAAASQTGLINSDIIIAPDLSRFKATKKDGHTEMIELGYQAAKAKIAEIKQLVGIKLPKEKMPKEKLPKEKRAKEKLPKEKLPKEKLPKEKRIKESRKQRKQRLAEEMQDE